MGEIKSRSDGVYRDFATDGIPASGGNEPYKPDIRALFTLIDVAVAAAQAGLATVSDTAARDAFYATPANQSKLVYVNNNNGSAGDAANGVYEFVNGPRLAQAFYQGVATVVQPLVDRASAAAGVVSFVAGAPLALPSGSDANEIAVANGTTPSVGTPFDVLLTVTNTAATYLTIGGVRLLISDGGGNAIAAGRLIAGNVASLTRSAGGVFVFNGLRSIEAADVVAPIADRLNTIAILTEQLFGADIAYPLGGDANNLIVMADTVPAVGVSFSALIVSSNTASAYLTVAGTRLQITNGGGQPIPAGGLVGGKIATFARSSGGAFVLQSLADAASGKAVDPLDPIRPVLVDNPYGSVVNNGGTISTTPVSYRVLGGGSSIGVAQGGNQATDAPNNILVNLLNARKRQAGASWVSEIVAIPGTGTLDMAAQFSSATGSAPEKIRTYVPGMNDCYFRLFVMQHGFPNMLAAMKAYLAADAAAGRISIVWTSPFPHPGRVNLAGGLPADKPMTYPVYKDAPVSATDIRNALGSDLVTEDWTGGGVAVPGVRTFAHYNTALRNLCRDTPTAICIDSAWAFCRYGLEPASKAANPATALDALYYSDNENHFSSAGYQAGYGKATVPAVDAILSGDLRTRYFRGDE